MAKKYTYSRSIETPKGVETFTAVEFDAFDEAIGAVERGVNDRKLQLDAEKEKTQPKLPMTPQGVPPTSMTPPGAHLGGTTIASKVS